MDEHPQPGQAFMSALVTEHFVLQSARSTTTSKAVGRSAVYLTCVSSSLVAFGFFAAATHRLAPLLATVLPALLILGIFTFVRWWKPTWRMWSACGASTPSAAITPRRIRPRPRSGGQPKEHRVGQTWLATPWRRSSRRPSLASSGSGPPRTCRFRSCATADCPVGENHVTGAGDLLRPRPCASL